MPSNQTTNYQLSQWSKSDQVKMEDFNADNAKIDAALKAEADTRAAAVNAINATLSGAVKLAVGSYTGNGASSRIIRVGFTPKAVYVCTTSGYQYRETVNGGVYGGLAVTGSPVTKATSDAPNALEIVSGGFKAVHFEGSYMTSTNSPFASYNYLAIG